MPITVERTLYTYDELNDKAKEKAREWYTSDGDDFYKECVYEDAERVGNILGIIFDQRKGQPEIYFSGFWSQGDGACFAGEYSYAKGAPAAIKAYAPQDTELYRIAVELQRIQKQAFYSLRARTKHRGYYYHSRSMDVSIWDSRDDHYSVREDLADDLEQALVDFADWIYKQLELAYEYSVSEEVVAENIRANDYTFTESGEREDA